MMTFKDLIHKKLLLNKATSNKKIQSVCKDIDINLRDCPFVSDLGIVNLHTTKGTH